MPEPLTKAQAQAVADIIAPYADEYYELIEKAKELFPGVEWASLCLPDWADPRERIPPKLFIGPRLPHESRRLMDRAILAYAEVIDAELRQRALLNPRR
jgi:hypothetical protein